MTTEQKIEAIKEAIEKADQFQSKLTDEVRDVPFLGSLKIRALLNNLGELATRYGEVGSHKSGSCCSAIFKNDNIKSITVVDSWESDATNEDKAYPQFISNTLKFKPESTTLKVIISDCFSLDLGDILSPIDLYLFDGPHSESDQRKALTYYLPALSDEFIYLCDDYDWEEVQKGTQDGIKEAGLEILFEKHLVSAKTREQGGHDNESWFNGFYVALLKKKQ